MNTITLIPWEKRQVVAWRLVFKSLLVVTIFCFFIYFLSYIRAFNLIFFGYFALTSLLLMIVSLTFFGINYFQEKANKKVYIFTSKRLCIQTRKYNFWHVLVCMMKSKPLEDKKDTFQKDEQVFQLKYITKWNEKSHASRFFLYKGLLVRIMWNYIEPDASEIIDTQNILEEHWEDYKQTIFEWIESERSHIGRNSER